MSKKKFKLKLWQKIMLGMVLGIILGLFDPSIIGYKVVHLVEPIGAIFSNMLKMIVVPLIFCAILYGITSIDDADTFTRLGGKAFAIYSITTMFAVTIGIVFTLIFEPGIGVTISLHEGVKEQPITTVYDMLINIIPANPIYAMATTNTLQVVVFAFFVGISIILAGEKSKDFKMVIISATQVMFKMVEIVLKTAPYGVFAIMSGVIAKYGWDVLESLVKFAAVVIAALALQYILFGVMLFMFAKVSPFPFYSKMLPVQALAFATSSSKATLPTAMKHLHKSLGVSKRSASFILPLGASMNMDATAIYLGATAVFFAQVMGVTLSMHDYLIIVLTSTIGSIGAAGFPGGGIVMMGIVLSSVGLPVEGISLIVGIDRILDMIRTMINITGDCTVTLIVDKIEGTFDEEVYNKKD
jgi:Na+/H+-dicarboxylate symporter